MGKQVAARLKKENLLYSKWGCSSVGRAPALQAGGREFESRNLHLVSEIKYRLRQANVRFERIV